MTEHKSGPRNGGRSHEDRNHGSRSWSTRHNHVALDPETVALVDELARIRSDVSALKLRDAELRASLIERLGTDVVGVDPAGTPRLRISHRYRRQLDIAGLRDAEPDLCESFTRVIEFDHLQVGP